MDMPAALQKRPASVGSISPPRVLCLASTLPPCRNSYTVRFKVSVVEWQRKNEASIYRTTKHFSIEGGRNHERKCRIPCISLPPGLCTKAKVAKGEDTMVLSHNPCMRGHKLYICYIYRILYYIAKEVSAALLLPFTQSF